MAFVNATGLQIKTIEEILDELATQQKAEIDTALNTSSDEPVGQLNGIFAAQCREIWEVVQVAYNGYNPDAAEGFLLEKLSALTGTLREGATKSTVACDIDIDSGTTLVAGTHFGNVTGEPGNRWTPQEDFTSPSNGVHSVVFEAEFAGAVVANSGTIITIATAVSGWNSITNPLDATVGKEIDTDAQLRQRREEELRATGSATVDAMRADIVADEDVLQCTVFENTTDQPDPVTGLPAKSFECVVFDGTPPVLTNDAIAQLIWDTKPAGIGSFGLESGVATDSQGTLHTLYFTRPTEVEIWVDIFVSIDISSGYAGSAALEAALVDLNESDLLQGRDVIAARLEAVAMTFAGVFDMTQPVELGLSASPTGTANISIGPREIARLDTSRITVTETFTAIP